MIRRLAVLALVTLAGCSGFRDALTAHPDVAARAADRQLTVDHLAQMIGPARSVPLSREVMDRVSELWVDYQLLAQAVAGGDSLLDSATVMEASWPLIVQRLADHLHDSLVAARSTLTDRELDSAFGAGDYRWLHHVLVAARGDSTAGGKAAKRRVAEGYLGQLRRGADFSGLARRVSEDPGSAPAGGSLGLVARGAMVKPFEDAAWALRPGQVSEVVETPFGYHIIWRPALEAVRDSFRVQFSGALAQRLDSILFDSLTHRTDIRVRRSAPALVRAAAEDIRSAEGGSRVMAVYRGGRLRERDLARWLQAFPPQARAMVLEAPDSTLREFIRSIVRNHMLLRTAEERGIRLTAADVEEIQSRYRGELSRLLGTLSVSPESLAGAGSEERRALAAQRVDAYFAAITASPPQRPFLEVPPFLADVLRSRFAWSVAPAGIGRALERARQIRGPEPPPAPPAPSAPRVTPAPGGPPIGAPPPAAGPAPVRPGR